MSTYATVEQVVARLPRRVRDDEAETLADEAEMGRLLDEAERMCDRILVPGRPIPATRRVLDPAALTERQRDSLIAAVAGFIHFALVVDEDDFARGLPDVTAVGSLQLAGRDLPRVAPQVVEALAGSGLIARSGIPYEPPTPPAA